jgi:elongation factor G
MPAEFQGPVIGDLNSRRGMILSTENRDNYTVVQAEVPLSNMFGYATVIRGMTKGMGTFSMEMSRYARVPVKIAEEILAKRNEQTGQLVKK